MPIFGLTIIGIRVAIWFDVSLPTGPSILIISGELKLLIERNPFQTAGSSSMMHTLFSINFHGIPPGYHVDKFLGTETHLGCLSDFPSDSHAWDMESAPRGLFFLKGFLQVTYREPNSERA